jgi:hypothetical protein
LKGNNNNGWEKNFIFHRTGLRVSLFDWKLSQVFRNIKQKFVVTSGQKLQVSKVDPSFFSNGWENFFISQPILMILVPIDLAFNADSKNIMIYIL